ncbi:metallophosphoesterase [Cognatiyoonia sp. IB215182]|uniref:metallophosphoesterase n=1 Tax=Cognatiyoonia sp. IB215182 TaxID=3097353 RepID=UPI002A0BFA11|nr:metallophosphoesterase [Cognatiyoonia sp. IB215182]MDX8351282.1 metallophosphoesterase [Cognatiyoonia sp. IB215182]
MEKVLVLTDLHICAPDARIVGLDPSQRLRAALDAALTPHPDAAGLILMGDLTHHGDATEYAVLREVLAPVLVPVMPMLGNHDRRDAFLAAFPHAPQTQSGHVQQAVDLETHRVITLDTLDGPPYPEGHHGGRLCAARLAFLENALEDKGARRALVCMHHPPITTGIPGMDQIMLANGDVVLRLLAQFPDTHLLLGHLHRTISGRTGGVSWTILKSPCHQGVLDLQSFNAHLSTNEPGAYGVVLMSNDSTIVHSEDVDVPGRQVFGGYG